MNFLGRIYRKVREVGFKNCLYGALLSEKYKRMQKIYGFETWHLSPYEWREYLQKTASYINMHNAKKVVDIGCGLGDLLRHINADIKIGIDIHEEVITAARALNDKVITYRVGSFNDITGEKDIDYMITLNFTHGGTEKVWNELYHAVARKNDIRHFIVDTVPENGPSHFLNFSEILPKSYKMIERMGPFLGGRHIEVWGKSSNKS